MADLLQIEHLRNAVKYEDSPTKRSRGGERFAGFRANFRMRRHPPGGELIDSTNERP
jgi:hypothetical protein